MVQQPSGTGDHHLGPVSQAGQLGAFADATVDCDTLYAEVPPQFDEGLMDLLGQLPGRCDDQGPDASLARSTGQTMEDGKREGSGLTGAGLGQAQDIPAFQCQGDGLFLDWGGFDEADRLNAGQDLRVKGKLFEIH